MNDEHPILLHDLRIMERMAADMAGYLDGDAVQWTIPRANMPRLTIGGYLMRQHRLQALREKLGEEERERLEAAMRVFEQAQVERVVRFENRSHQELHARLGEWVSYLRNLNSRLQAEMNYYAGVVDTRVVIGCLVDNLSRQPYQLETGVKSEVDMLDKNLGNRWEARDFIWETVWEDAYPRETYWWLYGCPKPVMSGAMA